MQEYFDLLFGLGEAKRAGLYNAYRAQDLDFSGMPVAYEKYRQHDMKHNANLRVGAILRLNNDSGLERWEINDWEMSSIAICIGGGRCAHLVGETLTVERIAKVMHDGFSPKYVAMPDGSFHSDTLQYKARNIHINKQQGIPYLTLDRIATEVIRQTPYLAEKNYSAVKDVIFWLNKEMFTMVKMNRREYALILKNESWALAYPTYWNVPERQAQMQGVGNAR